MKPRVWVCLVVIVVAAAISSPPAAAANVPAAPSDAISPLTGTGTGIGDVAPFSLETSGAGSDYTRAYLPNEPLAPSVSAHAPIPTTAPAAPSPIPATP